MRTEKRCLTCEDFTPDELDRNRDPLPPKAFASWGDCRKTGARMKDSWAIKPCSQVAVVRALLPNLYAFLLVKVFVLTVSLDSTFQSILLLSKIVLMLALSPHLDSLRFSYAKDIDQLLLSIPPNPFVCWLSEETFQKNLQVCHTHYLEQITLNRNDDYIVEDSSSLEAFQLQENLLLSPKVHHRKSLTLPTQAPPLLHKSMFFHDAQLSKNTNQHRLAQPRNVRKLRLPTYQSWMRNQPFNLFGEWMPKGTKRVTEQEGR